MKSFTQLLTLCLATSLAHIAQGIQIRMLSTADDRFDSNTPGATENVLFQYSAYDFSGVGWDNTDTRKSITLISDTHFLAAAHFTPTTTVNFRDTLGTVHTHTVSSYTSISNADYPDLMGNSDLLVGTLTSAVSSDINFYPILDPALSAIGQDILLYGQRGRIGESQIAAVLGLDASGTEGVSYRSDYFIASGGDDDAYFTGGDSGGPSFIVSNSGDLILTGNHWAVGDDAERDDDDNIITPALNRNNFDTAVPAYLTQLNSIGGLTVTTSSDITVVPEPSTSLVLGLTGLAFCYRRKR